MPGMPRGAIDAHEIRDRAEILRENRGAARGEQCQQPFALDTLFLLVGRYEMRRAIGFFYERPGEADEVIDPEPVEQGSISGGAR